MTVQETEQQKIERLMEVRYKVIADYPSSCFFVGEILGMNLECAGIGKTGSGVFARSVYRPEKYPHLFKRLEWWEERGIEDMPEHVKAKHINFSREIEYYHSPEWVNAYSDNKPHFATFNMFKEKYYLCADSVLPITESEYLAYNSTHP